VVKKEIMEKENFTSDVQDFIIMIGKGLYTLKMLKVRIFLPYMLKFLIL
jgi:hypothetical protein